MIQDRQTADTARAVSAVFFIGLLIFSGCGERAPERQTYLFEGPTMGTTYQVKVVGAELPAARKDQIDGAIRTQLDEVNVLMSTYLEESELSRFNRHDDTAFELSSATREVFQAALDLGRRSGGALDITVGPLVNAWGFGPGHWSPEGPTTTLSDDEVAALLTHIGYQRLELSEAHGILRKSDPDLYCDLSSLAKGYAVDRVAGALETLGATDFMVEVGGEIRARGENEQGRTWRIGIERPQLARGHVQRIVALDGLSLATSGDYRNYREVDGQRFSHIMDPRTGRPIQHRLASVSVLHQDCMTADGWATALLVLGEDEGFELASRENLAALFLVRDEDGFSEKQTPAFENLTRK